MRKGDYKGGGRKSWDEFCKSQVYLDHGDGMTILRNLDEHLENQGKEVVIVDTALAGTFFRIEDRETS